MTKTMMQFAAVAAVTVAGLPAQTSGVPVTTPFQQADQMGQAGWQMMPRPTTAPVAVATMVAGGRGGQVVTGKPVSATEERKTVQTLADGTQIESTDTNLFYRDTQGRTRVEQTMRGKRTILIIDPVAHVSMLLEPDTKVAHKVGGNAPAPVQRGGVYQTSPAGGRGIGVGGARGGGVGSTSEGGRGGTAFGDGFSAGTVARGRSGNSDSPAPTSEELGVQTVNGVAAQGTKMTQIIPAGRIGNNRDIHVVNERWYSQDLQMLVRTVNSDPRFGVTTYQLMNIVQAVPDPSLFQIPSEYTVVEGGN